VGYSGSTSKATSSRKVDANRRNAQHSETGLLCPEVGTNWNATAFSPVTRPYYVAALGRCSAKLVCGRGKESNLEEQAGKKYLRALDIETGNVFWETPQIGAVDGKRNARALVTAGWILFYGTPAEMLWPLMSEMGGRCGIFRRAEYANRPLSPTPSAASRMCPLPSAPISSALGCHDLQF